MKKSITIILVALSLLHYGCTEPGKIKVYVLDRGQLIVRNIFPISPGHPKLKKPLVMGDASFLVVHPKGILLWDTGIADSIAHLKPGLRTPLALFTLEKTLPEQLAEIGYTIADIDYFAPSHLHFDHVGCMNAMKEATILVQQEEFDAAFSENAEKLHFDPRLYDQIPRKNFQIIPSTYDVFGDGSMVIHKAPGHSPGHQVAVVQLENQKVMFSGDLYHLHYNRENKMNPTFGYDDEMNLKTMDVIEAMLVDLEADLWIQHDPTFNDTIKYSPFYYQ